MGLPAFAFCAYIVLRGRSPGSGSKLRAAWSQSLPWLNILLVQRFRPPPSIPGVLYLDPQKYVQSRPTGYSTTAQKAVVLHTFRLQVGILTPPEAAWLRHPKWRLEL